MTDTKKRTLDTIQLNRQKLNFQSYPMLKKQFVCLYNKNNKHVYRKFIHPRFFIYSSMVCFIVQPIAILVQ